MFLKIDGGEMMSLETTLPECPTILMVDDQSNHVPTLARWLEERFDVHLLLVQSPEDALDLMTQHEPALVILNGDSMCAKSLEMVVSIKKTYEFQSLPMLMVVSDLGCLVGREHGDGLNRVDRVELPAQEELFSSKVGTFLELSLLRKKLEHANVRLRLMIEEQAQREERIRSLELMNRTLKRQGMSLARELEQSNQGLQQFSYAASHDLQEPLRLISGYVQLLVKRYHGTMDAKVDLYLEQVVDGVRHMQGLINGLLDFSRIGSRQGAMIPTSCERVFDQALQLLHAEILASMARITHDPLPTIHADPLQLIQVFRHLIDNAIKFQNGTAPEIHISVEKEGDKWIFSCQDNGIGIPPQFAERVFLIFQKLQARTRYPGIGMGLPICKRIVERHGGRIWVEPQTAEGTLIRFSIPEDPKNIE
ncbi:MAG: hypothetical protein HQL84_15355 [Magnetococcales bacterium]|nr:hypothetical protein [Magnetococcales bacterium]MBF0151397.1 hypothetical protein [Magnetococcales bacterium]MBF0174341.1 hypothetical protein [Magnetococcales bacterium]MBF0348204.1 hypothetical protein [Magnetococcales bacterium]